MKLQTERYAGKIDGMWKSERYGQVRITTKERSTELVVEFPGEPKAFGNLQSPGGNTGELWFPADASCNQDTLKAKRGNPFTWDNADSITVEGEIGEKWTKVAARAMTAEEKKGLARRIDLNDMGNHDKDGVLNNVELMAAFLR